MKQILAIISLALSINIFVLYLAYCIVMWCSINATEYFFLTYEAYFMGGGIVTIVYFFGALIVSYVLGYSIRSILSWIFTGIVIVISWGIYFIAGTITNAIWMVYVGVGVSALTILFDAISLKKIPSST